MGRSLNTFAVEVFGFWPISRSEETLSVLPFRVDVSTLQEWKKSRPQPMLKPADPFTRHRHHHRTTRPPPTPPPPPHRQHKPALQPDLPHRASYHLDLRLLAHPQDCPVLHPHAPRQAFASKPSPAHPTAWPFQRRLVLCWSILSFWKLQSLLPKIFKLQPHSLHLVRASLLS